MTARDDLIASGLDHFQADAIIRKARAEAVEYTHGALLRMMGQLFESPGYDGMTLACVDTQLSALAGQVDVWNESLITD